MVGKVSKAVLGQRRRQKRERGERVIQQQKQMKKKSSHDTNQPTQNPEEPTNNNRMQPISNHYNPELADFQEAELEARNQANDLLEDYNLAVENEMWWYSNLY
ncbi:hypothetical protein PSTG_00871 [Puccinia striiformis f. sp. tritici PST-78]|uniref:Uncharacterized protein n=1 Tax=Puccinia striiformis f. sp. tritici PST-78 TaxID=1165861 RepID=A0A0L0W337_9BASI|nr:hypothetical protein PSTG_00871 [Puccinia striiformis f. sp. tritici PST-78]